MLNISKNLRRSFNTACVAYDIKSKRYFYRRNQGVYEKDNIKNSMLFEKKRIIPKETLEKFSLGNCAEVQAINKALNAGAKLKNGRIAYAIMCAEIYAKTKYPTKNWQIVFEKFWEITNSNDWDFWASKTIEILPKCILEKKNNISLPDLRLVTFSKFSERDGFGEPFDGKKLSIFLKK